MTVLLLVLTCMLAVTDTKNVSEATPADDPQTTEADIERTPENLAETVDVRHAELDVDSTARATVVQLRDRATTAGGHPRLELVVGAVGVVRLVVGLVRWRGR